MSEHSKPIHIAVSGAGIAGLSAAIALRRLGMRPVIFESAPEIKALGSGLVLAANAMQALQRIGIAGQIIPAGKVLELISVLDQLGGVISRTDSSALNARFGVSNFAIHRADLHRILLEAAVGIPLDTGKKVVGCSQDADSATLHFQDGSIYRADAVLAADGIHSAIRQQLFPESKPRYAGYTCWRAVPVCPEIELEGPTETWGPNGRIGLVPLINHQIYWYACVNAPEQAPAMRDMGMNELRRMFQDYHYPTPQVLEATKDAQLIWNDIIDLKPLPAFARGRVLLLGDAGHATTPNMGQGACQALEDVAVLMDEWEKQPGMSATEIFLRFEKRRLKRVHSIVKGSWTIGKVAQWTHPLAIFIRNNLFRITPDQFNQRRLEALFTTDFQQPERS